MRCLSCNCSLTDFEATRRSINTMEYLDLCTSCFYTIRDEVPTLDRTDLYHEDGNENGSQSEDIDYELDSDEEM